MLARRDFIKTTGAVLGGMTLPAVTVRAQALASFSSETIPNRHRGIAPTRVMLSASVIWDFDAMGNQYAMDLALGTLSKYTPSGQLLWQRGGSKPTDKKLLNVTPSLAAGVGGKIYAADAGNSRVTIYSSAGHIVNVIRSNRRSPINTPRDIALANRRLYVANTLSHAINIYGLDGRHQSSFGSLGFRYDQLNGPTSVAVAERGEIYVVDSGNRGIKVFDHTGVLLDLFDGAKLGGIDHFDPSYIQMGPDGILYACDGVNGQIAALTQKGKLLDLIDLKLSNGSTAQPKYLAFSPDGTLVVSATSALPRFG